jgi:hypothetical protein
VAALRELAGGRADLLADAYFGYADLTNANLASADIADIDFADVFANADFTGAWWPADTPVPEGWELDTGSGRLVEARADGV